MPFSILIVSAVYPGFEIGRSKYGGWVISFLLSVRSLCPEVGRYCRHVKGADVGAVTPRKVDVAVVSLHTADDPVSLQMEGNEVTKRIWSGLFVGK